MPYIARKTAKFDRDYSIGETIPDAVVDPGRAASLIAMGRLSYIEEPKEGAQKPQEGAQEPGGVNGPDGDENTAGEAVGATEPEKKGKAKK